MIDTDRLHLRPYRLDDFEEMAALFGDERVMASLGRGPTPREESWARLLRYTGHWTLFDYGLFAVFEKASGRFVGETGMADFKRGLGPRFDDVPEAAWILSSEAQGRGYATEAAEATHRWLAHSHLFDRTVCIIRPDNGGSLRVAEKLGYQRFDEGLHRGLPMLMLERKLG